MRWKGRTSFLSLAVILFALLMVPEIEGNSSGRYNSTSGCNCHAASSNSLTVTHNFPTQYDSSTPSYNITIGFSGGVSSTNGGFSLEVDKGTLLNPGLNTQISGGSATHQNSYSNSWSLQWTPPSSGSGNVTVDISVLSANGNGANSGDVWDKISLVVQQAPSISYLQSPYVLNKNAYSQILPSVNGSGITHWSISPSLPAGLIFDNNTGEMSGTPTVTSQLTTHTVTAVYSGGIATTTVDITVNEGPPRSISYGYNSSGMFWDFNNGLQNWTVTSSTYVNHSTLACSVNGTSGGSIKIHASSMNMPEHATSPQLNLQGFSSLPLNAWVLQGSVNCGEEPDSGEDLQIQYIDTGGNWVTLNTWLGSTLGGTAQNWSTNLPSAALHANTQIRIYQNSGSGTCCDTWFVDDVLIVVPTSDYVLTKNVTMNTVTPTFSGGPVQTWAISPTLPTGLIFDSTTGEISGTPTVLSQRTVYTVIATNSVGSNSTTINVQVNDVAPNSLTYSSNSIVGYRGLAITPVTPTVGGGQVTSWGISPNLPTGLFINSTTGEISGTPTIIMNQTSYIIWANNSGGSATTILTIELLDTPPISIVYSSSSLSLSKDALMTPITPTSTGGIVDTWSVSPPLPGGLSLDSSTGEISGTPIAMSPLTNYTVTATNTAGSASVNLTIIVNDAAPSSIIYNPSSFTLTLNSEMNSVTPTASGGAAQAWSISPPLPAGLSIGGLNGTIFGTPTIISTSTVYTITATNLGGNGTTTVTIQVNDVAPYSLSISPNLLQLTKGSLMTPATPTASGGTVTTWSISPSLPTGLSIDTVNGTISGTPTTNYSLTTFTITGANSGGSGTITVTIIVEDAAPSGITYSQSTFILTKNITISSTTPTYSGGVTNSWAISPTLPVGLSFNNSTGEIGGTPTLVSPFTVYTVTATNSAGSGNTTIIIQVNDIQPPNIVAVNNTGINTIQPYLFVQGGTFEISPDLPLGLTLNISSGEIDGTPTQQWSNSTFTAWCNHTDGSSVTWDFTIEILEDSDGDGMPNELPVYYNQNNVASPGIIEDLDDDNDGISDINELSNGTNPINPDTDSDGVCDGSISLLPQCVTGPDAFPNDPTETIDTDGDGMGDNADAFPSNSTETTDTDGDGIGDNADTFPSDSNETTDTDGDGIGDNADTFPSDSNETTDTDGDGIGDNADGCPQVWGNSTGQLIGCLDSDGDGLADLIDAFPSDGNRTSDGDMDGYDDLIEDDCPNQGGNSTIDLLGCLDSDADGVSDINDLFPNDSTDWNDDDGDGVGNNSDVFPQDANETLDSDGDGVGDNTDLFPQDSNESIDSDGDGIGNNEDQYPLQNNFMDTDNDGIFDVEDIFPTDPTQWQDADNDGYGDNLTGLLPDLFPSDESQWADLDGDGYGDNWGNETWNQTRLLIFPGIFIENASNADHCPDIAGNSSADGYFGCLDLDGDSIADLYDDDIDLGGENNQTQQTNDSDNDGVADLYDFCPNSQAEAIVDFEGCLIDQDNDGVGDVLDQCPNTKSGVEVNIEGCQILTDEPDDFFEEMFSGDSGTIAKTVGFGAILIAFIGFIQTNFVAALLPDAFRWVQVFRKKSKLSAEEELELGHLQSVVQAYFNDPGELKEELLKLKSDLTARFTNGEIKKGTREIINILISDLIKMDIQELKRTAHDDRFFGLVGTMDTEERLEMLEMEMAMRDFDSETAEDEMESFGSDYIDKNTPTSEMKGAINEDDGYEYIEYPPDSSRWFIRNTRTNMWDEWKD